VKAGDDLAALMRVVELASVVPGPDAVRLANDFDKDARLVQVVLDESVSVLRASHGVLICETRHGFICANAGVDMSNAPGEDVAVLLPLDPDASARRIRAGLTRSTSAPRSGANVYGVIISDSFGRPWRLGVADVAIGAAGVRVLDDWRGRRDAQGRELQATDVAVADQLAAAADLARSKDSQEPVVVIRGAEHLLTDEDGPGAAALRRPRELDLFR
jgi:coenzyme F420-0:L-glutamate ligase/coenzyme F420-1:gamma-L-glutamate ligase